MKKPISLVTFLIFINCITLFAQSKEISGRVIGQDDGESIPGVSVKIKGTTIGTVTNFDGTYTLSVPEDAQTIVFSCVGMKSTEVNIDGRFTIDIIMDIDIFGLGDIIITGYTTQTRESLTGSVSTIDKDKIKTSASSNIISHLQGQVSGVTITSDNTPGSENIMVRVRGFGTINDNDPLYIIDGVPVEPRYNLNPSDIESISILKDASAAAIYGTRGANGVVIITTTHGHSGEKLNVNFSLRTGVTYPLTQYNVLNTQEFGEILWMQARNTGYTPGVDFNHPQYGSGPIPVIPDYIFPAGTFEGDPSANPELYEFPDYPICRANKTGTDWYDEIYRVAPSREYNFSVKGGSENARYAFSGNYLDEKGYVIYTGFKRISFLNNLDVRFTKWFKAGESIQVFYTDHSGDLNNGENNVIQQASLANPIIPLYDIMGNFAGAKAPGTVSDGPVANLYRSRNNTERHYRILGNIFGEINFFKGLVFKSLLGYNVDILNHTIYRLAWLESSSPGIDELYERYNSEFQWNWYNTLSYATKIANVHNLNMILGTEAIEYNGQWYDAGRSKYFSTDPDYMKLDSGEINQINSGSGTEWSLYSLFGRLNYDYRGKYFLDFTLRRDGSSRFGPGNRYAVFPAFSVAYTLTEEDFMAGMRGWLDFFKLRFGWGQSGNDRIGNYNIYSTYTANNHHAAYDINGTNTSSIVGFQPSTMGNKDVTWETTSTMNGGLDAIFLNNT